MNNNDRTLRAVNAQFEAMGCAQYEIGVRDGSSGKMMNRSWSPDQVLENLPWLRHMNVKGNDIYVRPAGTWHHLVLVDDVDLETIARMRLDGVEPALAVETSPANFQVWISVVQPNRKIVPPEIRSAIARRLAREYGGDPASADARHYGRLSGFTNRKPRYRSADGRQPWVLLREHIGKASAAAADLVATAEAEASLQEQVRQQEQQAARQISQPSRPGDARSAVDIYRSEIRGLENRYGPLIMDPDVREWSWSKCDWIVVTKLLERGHDPETVAAAMREASPDIDSPKRKAGHVEDYIWRTIDNAVAAVAARNPELDLDLDRLSGSSGRHRGPGPR